MPPWMGVRVGSMVAGEMNHGLPSRISSSQSVVWSLTWQPVHSGTPLGAHAVRLIAPRAKP